MKQEFILKRMLDYVSKLIYLSFGIVFINFSVCFSADFYVAKNGNDTNPGTKDRPFTTLERARDALREWKQQIGLPPDEATIWVRGGVYEIKKTFSLDSRDAGVPGARITYQAYPGEKVKFIGGQQIPSSAFQPVTDPEILKRISSGVSLVMMNPDMTRYSVLQVNLKSLGVTNFGEIDARGSTQPIELIFNDERMKLARWPNEGYITYGKVTDVGARPGLRNQTLWPGAVPVDQNSPEYLAVMSEPPDKPGKFLYINRINEGDKPSRWLQAKDPMLFGFWNYRWASQAIQIAKIDPEKQEITLAGPHTYGLKDYGQMYAFNLMEEIDQPGEYYLDRQTGILYFLPPSPIMSGKAFVSMLETPMIEMNNVSNVIIRDFTFEVSRSSCIIISGGSNNLIAGCTIANFNGNGVTIQDYRESPGQSFNNGVAACEIYNMKRGGISLSGGNRKTLSPAGHYAVNNHCYNNASISLQGCGNRAANNLIHDNTGRAISYNGNDHLIEYNEIFNCLNDADDVGTIGIGRDPSCQGNVIRYNFIHDNSGAKDLGNFRRTGSSAIYLDDGTSGQIIFGNVFYRTARPDWARFGAIFIHGGKENLIVNNIVIDCELAFGFNPWSQERWEKYLVSGDMNDKLRQQVDINNPPFSTKYPRLANLKENSGRNLIWNNVVYKCGQLISHPKENKMENNFVTSEDPGFVDAANLNFQLRENSIVYQKIPGFKKIPFEKTGLYLDEYRDRLPTVNRH